MKITIIGGHGKVARRVARLLADAGHVVVSVIRNPSQANAVMDAGASALVGDVERLDTADIAGLLADSDAVMWAAGAGGGNPARTRAVDRDAAIRTVDAAQRAGIDRFVMVSYIRSGRDDTPASNPFRTYADAKADADAHLRASKLNWTILGPGQLTDEDATGLIDSGEGVTSGPTSRANTAAVAVECLLRDDLSGVTLNFIDGSVPIVDAIQAAQRRL